MQSALPDSQLAALVSLLTDRDEAIVRRCRARLFAEGERGRKALRKASDGGDSELAAAARGALAELEGQAVDQAIVSRAADAASPLDLREGALLIARTANPSLDAAAIDERIATLADALRALAAPEDDPSRLARAMRKVLAEGAGLAGNHVDYYDPENSFLDRVLERRLGIPISLSVIYLLVARAAGHELHGIGMPGHFVVRLASEDRFLDPFSGARELSRKECMAYLQRAGFGEDERVLEPMPDRFILARMLANLVNAYRRRQDPERAERYRRLFDAVRGRPEA